MRGGGRTRERRHRLFLPVARRSGSSSDGTRGGALALLQEQTARPDPGAGKKERDGPVGLGCGPDGGADLLFYFFYFFSSKDKKKVSKKKGGQAKHEQPLGHREQSSSFLSLPLSPPPPPPPPPPS